MRKGNSCIGNTGETSERLGEAYVAFPKDIDTILH